MNYQRFIFMGIVVLILLALLQLVIRLGPQIEDLSDAASPIIRGGSEQDLEDVLDRLRGQLEPLLDEETLDALWEDLKPGEGDRE